MVVEDLFILLPLLSLVTLLLCQVYLHSLWMQCDVVRVYICGTKQGLSQSMSIHKQMCSMCNSHKAPPPPALAHSANPADRVMTNSSYCSSPAPASPRSSSRPFLMSIHWAAWGTWEDLPQTLPLGATKFYESLSPVFGSFEKSGLSVWQCSSDTVEICTWGVLLAFSSPFIKRD